MLNVALIGVLRKSKRHCTLIKYVVRVQLNRWIICYGVYFVIEGKKIYRKKYQVRLIVKKEIMQALWKKVN
jgi:hypothetical protein